MRDFIWERRDKIKFFNTLHSFSQLVRVRFGVGVFNTLHSFSQLVRVRLGVGGLQHAPLLQPAGES